MYTGTDRPCSIVIVGSKEACFLPSCNLAAANEQFPIQQYDHIHRSWLLEHGILLLVWKVVGDRHWKGSEPVANLVCRWWSVNMYSVIYIVTTPRIESQLDDGGSGAWKPHTTTKRYGGGLQSRENQHKQDAARSCWLGGCRVARLSLEVARTPVTRLSHSRPQKNGLAVGRPCRHRNPSHHPIPAPFPSLFRGLLVPSAEPCCWLPTRPGADERRTSAVRRNLNFAFQAPNPKRSDIFGEPNPTGVPCERGCPAQLGLIAQIFRHFRRPRTEDPAGSRPGACAAGRLAKAQSWIDPHRTHSCC